jgi:primosomal protein N' (replication factor Y)
LNIPKIELSEDQERAFDFIKRNRTSLLFGDTGSGKTFIYKKMIAEVLKDGGDVIFLVPEINLIPQMVERVGRVFGHIVSSWHSKVSTEDKNLIIKNIYRGETKVVVGTLSSLFLPFSKLSLIIVDEEHSESYSLSQNRNFRFNAKDMAIYLASKLEIHALLGSATPSLNSYVKFPTFRLKGQFVKNDKKFIFNSDDFAISEMIENKIADRLQKKEQTIIFIPTKGNFKYLDCLNCGENYSCPNCSIRLTIYSEKSFMKCNMCGFHRKIPLSCDKCGNEDLKVSRVGTVEVVRKLKKRFPEASIINFDSDRVKKIGDLQTILNDFSDRKIDILVGTQMISKGHDYPNVTLSVILGIDFGINIEDFQSYEKTLSLLVQISGRSGRKKSAEIIIQTKYEKLYKKFIKDYEEFLKYEKLKRGDKFPPFKNFIRILIEDRDEKISDEVASHIELYIILFSNLKIFFSGKAPIYKIDKLFRNHIVLKVEKVSEATPFIKEMLNLIPKNFKKIIAIEINPASYS